MGSVRPHSQAVAYPAFQHWRDIGALTSPLDNNVTSVPVVHHAKGIQNNMVGTLYPEEVRVAYSPAQWQQGSTQSKQNFQGYTQRESQRTLARTRFQQPNSGNSASSSKHVSTQHSSSFGTSANENTVRDSVNEGGQQSGCSEHKGSNLNINPGLSQKRLNAFSVCTVDTVAAQKQRVPQLYALLTSNSSSSSGETNVNIELSTNTHFSDDRDCQSQQVKSSLAALNCGKSRKLNVDHSEATNSSTSQQHVSFPSLCSQPSTNIVLPVGKMAPPTDDEIMEFIREKVAYFRTLLNPENVNGGLTFNSIFNGWNFRSNEGDPTPQSDCIMSNDVAHSCSTSTSDKDVERNGLYCAAAVGQTLQQDSSKGSNENATLTAKSREMSHCATSASKEHSTGTQASVVGNSKHTPKTFVEKSTLVEFDKHLDVTMPVNYDDKCFYLGDCEDETIVSSKNESFHSKWCDKYLQTGVTTLCYTLTALKELIASLENVETIAGMDNLPEVLLQQYWNGDIDNLNLFTSTEYLQIMEKVAATCTKNEDESPVVLTAVSEMDLAKLTENRPSSSLNCSSSQEEPTPVWLNIVKTLDDIEQMSGVSCALEHTREREKGDTGLNLVKMVGMDNVQGVTDVSEDRPTKSSSVVYEHKTFEPASLIENQDVNTKENCDVTRKKVIAHSKLILSMDTIQIHNLGSVPTNQSALLCNQKSHEDVKKDGDSVHSETDVSAALSENKVKGYSPPSQIKSRETVYSLKDPQYDDVSDDELSELTTKFPNKEHEELRFPANSEDLQYEYVSEDENSQIENVALGKSSLAQVPTGNRQLPCENKNYGHEQVQAQMKTEIISEKELIPRKQVSPEIETCISCSPSSVLKDGDKIDDQMDDDWIVIPISMYDLKFEPEDEEHDSPEKVVLDNGETRDNETESDTSPLPASAPSQMEVFDTLEMYLQQKSLHGFGWRSACSTPEHELDSSMSSHTLQSRRASYSESEASYETEDSCDYPFESKQNLLTVSSELLEKGSTLAMDDSESEKESEDDEVTNVQRPGKLIEAKAASEYVQHESNGQISKIDDIIVIDSDTEDDSDQNCRTMAKRKTISSDSDDSGDAPCSQHSPKKKLQKKKHKQSMSEERRNTERTHSSESEDSSDALIAGKTQPSTETMERLCGTAKKKSEEPRLSTEDTAKKQLQSVGKEAYSTLRPNPVILRFFVHNSTEPTGHLKLIEESQVHRQGNHETRAPKNPKTSKNTNSCEKKTQHLHKKVKVSKAKPKQLSSPSQEGPSISTASSSSTSGQLSGPRQSSASSKGLFQTGETTTSCSLPKSKQRTSIPGQNMSSSNEQLSRSNSIPATLDTCTPTKDPISSESMLSTTRKQVIKDWKETFFPTKMERKINSRKKVESRTTNLDSSREARPGPSHYDWAPRRRHSSHETVTPLMKKAKTDAIEWTKAINREDPKKRKSFTVGDNYKWSEKPKKGSYKSGKKWRTSPRSRL